MKMRVQSGALLALLLCTTATAYVTPGVNRNSPQTFANNKNNSPNQYFRTTTPISTTYRCPGAAYGSPLFFGGKRCQHSTRRVLYSTTKDKVSEDTTTTPTITKKEGGEEEEDAVVAGTSIPAAHHLAEKSSTDDVEDSDDKVVKVGAAVAVSIEESTAETHDTAATTTTAKVVLHPEDTEHIPPGVVPGPEVMDPADPSTLTPPKAKSVSVVKERKLSNMTEIDETELIRSLETASELAVDEILEETCEVSEDGTPVDDLCVDEGLLKRAKGKLKRVIGKTLRLVRSGTTTEEDETEDDTTSDEMFTTATIDKDEEEMSEGEMLERGWEKRANSSALRRNAEVWKFALQCVFKALKPRKLSKKGAPEEEVKVARIEAATFIRDGLVKLGPTFVKLGQVVSTRTDVLPVEYTDVLKTLVDDVPGFSGARAKEIVSRELGKPCDTVFKDFSEKPLAAASLGQVHTAHYKGKKVAVKVQRAGLKELFDIDLKNLKKLAELLERFDPKTDGADRNWVQIYEDSEVMLYKEIDYLNEADNAERFARDFSGIEWVRVPEVYREVTTPRVLTMEFVEAFKLTDIKKVEEAGLDKKLLARRTADSFLRQIVETGYFHCDPHPGNLCVDKEGNLVYFDYGMMDELKPNVRSGFRKFCTALFAGGPTIGDLELARNAKMLVDGVEEAGVLARGADRLAVEKLARYFMRAFKDNQLGKSSSNIKQTVGVDLQTLTENNVFRFPSTFTFIFRSFASVDGIGKGLDKDYDIGKLAQPFIEKFTESQKGYKSDAEKNLSIFSKATGLNKMDINTAITSPKRIAYIEETLRAMESGSLKIRVRSLENEKALERMGLTQSRMENLLLASLALNLAGIASGPILTGVGLLGALAFSFQAFTTNAKVKKFDKTQAKFVSTKFEGEDEEKKKKK